MKRTNAKQRKKNAISFYQYLVTGNEQKAAIVIERTDSKTNPNINRCRFITHRINSPASDVVIAESVDGIAGCFRELISNIHGDIPQKGFCGVGLRIPNFFENDFKDWLRKTCHMKITWYDGLVMMIEYKRR